MEFFNLYLRFISIRYLTMKLLFERNYHDASWEVFEKIVYLGTAKGKVSKKWDFFSHQKVGSFLVF